MTAGPMVHIVEDDDAVRDSLALLLEAEGMQVATYASAQSFLAVAGVCRGCVLADVEMDRVDGLEMLRSMRAQSFSLPIVFMTGRPSADLTATALRAGAVRVLDKPFSSEALIEALNAALAAS